MLSWAFPITRNESRATERRKKLLLSQRPPTINNENPFLLRAKAAELDWKFWASERNKKEPHCDANRFPIILGALKQCQLKGLRFFWGQNVEESRQTWWPIFNHLLLAILSSAKWEKRRKGDGESWIGCAKCATKKINMQLDSAIPTQCWLEFVFCDLYLKRGC